MKLEIFDTSDRLTAARILRAGRSFTRSCAWRRPSWRSRLDACAIIALHVSNNPDPDLADAGLRVFDAIAACLENDECHMKAS
jgi:hypothetical protein